MKKRKRGAKKKTPPVECWAEDNNNVLRQRANMDEHKHECELPSDSQTKCWRDIYMFSEASRISRPRGQKAYQ